MKNELHRTDIKLSFPFIYSSKSKEELEGNTILEKTNQYHPENLLSYADRLFKKESEYRYKNYPNILCLFDNSKKEIYHLDIEEINIDFFQEDVAFLSLWLKLENYSLEEIYKINKLVSNIYSKSSNNTYVYLGKKQLKKLQISIDAFNENYLPFF